MPDTICFKFAQDKIRVISGRITDREKRWRGKDLFDTAIDRIVVGNFASALKWTHLDDRHGTVGIEDHGSRVAVDRPDVGKPAHVSAKPVISPLHDKCLDALFVHGGTHGRPAPLKFGVACVRDQFMGVHFAYSRSMRSGSADPPPLAQAFRLLMTFGNTCSR